MNRTGERHISARNHITVHSGGGGGEENEDNILFGLLAKSVPKQKIPNAELWWYKFSHIPFMKFVCVSFSKGL